MFKEADEELSILLIQRFKNLNLISAATHSVNDIISPIATYVKVFKNYKLNLGHLVFHALFVAPRNTIAN